MMLFFVTSKRLFNDWTIGFWAESETGETSTTATAAIRERLDMVGSVWEG